MNLTDTGPIVAAVDANDLRHEECRAVLATLRGPLVTTLPCLTEAFYLPGRVGWRAQAVLWQMVADGDRFVVHLPDEWEIRRAAQLMEQYRDVPMDFGDASLVAAAETLGLTTVFSFDSHFRAYRPLGGAFLVLP